jgi:hypothetical protein
MTYARRVVAGGEAFAEAAGAGEQVDHGEAVHAGSLTPSSALWHRHRRPWSNARSKARSNSTPRHKPFVGSPPTRRPNSPPSPRLPTPAPCLLPPAS